MTEKRVSRLFRASEANGSELHVVAIPLSCLLKLSGLRQIICIKKWYGFTKKRKQDKEGGMFSPSKVTKAGNLLSVCLWQKFAIDP